jgi:hypothetical protein
MRRGTEKDSLTCFFQDHNLKVVSLLKQIDMVHDLMSFKERMMMVMEMDIDKKRVVYKKITELMLKIEALTEEMRNITDAPRKTNTIIGHVL